MTKKRVIGIGETVLDILFKDDQPQKAVPGGSTFNSIVSLGRAGVPCTMVTEALGRQLQAVVECHSYTLPRERETLSQFFVKIIIFANNN